MKLCIKKNKYFLASVLILSSFSSGNAVLNNTKLTSDLYLSGDITEPNLTQSFSQKTLSIGGKPFKAEWAFTGDITEDILAGRLHSPSETIYPFETDRATVTGGQVQVSPESGSTPDDQPTAQVQAITNQVFEIKFFDNPQGQEPALATLYLAGPDALSVDLKQLSSAGFKAGIAGLKTGIQATAAHLAERGADALTAAKEAVAPTSTKHRRHKAKKTGQ